MKVTEPGRVTDRLWLLGREESCLWWLDGGPESVLMGGGMTYVIPDLVKQVEDFGLNPQKLSRLIIHHSHFDHVGAVPYLKKIWPWIRITASIAARDLLALPKVRYTVFELNRAMLDRFGLADRAAEFGLDGPPIEVEEAVTDGDLRPCGELSLEFIETPGHSKCSMSVYVPELKLLSASDGGGIPYQDEIFAAANSDYDEYEKSLARLATYQVEIHLAEHYGAQTGEDGRSFMDRSIRSARRTRAFIEEALARTGDVDAATREVGEMLSQSSGGYFLPEEVMNMVLGRMTRFIADKMRDRNKFPLSE